MMLRFNFSSRSLLRCVCMDIVSIIERVVRVSRTNKSKRLQSRDLVYPLCFNGTCGCDLVQNVLTHLWLEMQWNLQEALSLLKAAQVITAQPPDNQAEDTDVVKLISSPHRPPSFITSHYTKKKGRNNMMFCNEVWPRPAHRKVFSVVLC